MQDDEHIAPELLEKIAQSEKDGGIDLSAVPLGAEIRVQTRNTLYSIRKISQGYEIKGNAKYCPDWTKCLIPGSTFGGSLLKLGFIGVGMILEFIILNQYDNHLCPGKTVHTSRIEKVEMV